MKKHFLKLAVPLLVAFLPAITFADQSFIVDYFKNFQTLEANFSQEISTKDREDTTSGYLIIEKSASDQKVENPRFVFDYTKPYQQTLVSNGQQFWFYDVDLMQVVIKPLKDVVNNPVLKILLTDEPLSDNFNITEVRSKRDYLLTPKKISTDMDVTDIQVNFANNKIHSFKVKDVTGQTVSFVMKNVVENKPVKASVFDFKIPEDVDVIDETK